jgi:hypothetical protein
LTARGFGDIAPGRKKGGLNFLYICEITAVQIKLQTTDAEL